GGESSRTHPHWLRPDRSPRATVFPARPAARAFGHRRWFALDSQGPAAGSPTGCRAADFHRKPAQAVSSWLKLGTGSRKLQKFSPAPFLVGFAVVSLPPILTEVAPDATITQSRASVSSPNWVDICGN